MGRFLLAMAAMLILLVLPQIAEAGDITYSIQDYPADQNGATLSGTIVTDGTIGDLAATDISSWTFTITPVGGSPFTYSSSDTGGSTMLLGQVVASQTDITIASANAQTSNTLRFSIQRAARNELEYTRILDGTNQYTGGADDKIVWSTSDPNMGGTDPWVIATAGSVPEPSSLIFGGLGAFVAIAYNLARKRIAVRAKM